MRCRPRAGRGRSRCSAPSRRGRSPPAPDRARRAVARARTPPAGRRRRSRPSRTVSPSRAMRLDAPARPAAAATAAPAAETSASSRVVSIAVDEQPGVGGERHRGTEEADPERRDLEPRPGHLLDLEAEGDDRDPVAEGRQADRAGDEAKVAIARAIWHPCPWCRRGCPTARPQLRDVGPLARRPPGDADVGDVEGTGRRQDADPVEDLLPAPLVGEDHRAARGDVGDQSLGARRV